MGKDPLEVSPTEELGTAETVGFVSTGGRQSATLCSSPTSAVGNRLRTGRPSPTTSGLAEATWASLPWEPSTTQTSRPVCRRVSTVTSFILQQENHSQGRRHCHHFQG